MAAISSQWPEEIPLIPQLDIQSRRLGDSCFTSAQPCSYKRSPGVSSVYSKIRVWEMVVRACVRVCVLPVAVGAVLQCH